MIETASELVAALKDCAKHKTLYVMGCFGAPMTKSNKSRYINSEPYNHKPERIEMINAATPDTFGFDCVCLIKGMFWGWSGNMDDIYGGADYLTDIVPDLDAEQMLDVCDDISTDFSNILPGEVVGMEGHIGVYVGDGLVIESTPRWKNCVQYTVCANMSNRTDFPRRYWVRHGKLPYCRYDTEESSEPAPSPTPETHGFRYRNVEDLPEYYRKEIQAYIDHGSLKGRGSKKGLDLSEDMTRILVICQREFGGGRNG